LLSQELSQAQSSLKDLSKSAQEAKQSLAFKTSEVITLNQTLEEKDQELKETCQIAQELRTKVTALMKNTDSERQLQNLLIERD
jgi:cytochrome c-type biogenesis protein CcmH/NrfF